MQYTTNPYASLEASAKITKEAEPVIDTTFLGKVGCRANILSLKFVAYTFQRFNISLGKALSQPTLL